VYLSVEELAYCPCRLILE